MIPPEKYRTFQWMLVHIAWLLLAVCTLAAAAEPTRNPNSAKACAICHYRWIDTFFVEGRGTDLVPYQSEKVVAQPDMCFSCHDGSVADSRERMMHGKAHKTDVQPPVGMQIPEVFPLDESGKVQCATCHTAHAVESGPGSEETIFMRTSNKNSAMCRMCHPGKVGGPAAGNHSLAVVEQSIPQPLKKRGAHVGGSNKMICETCHAAHGSISEKYLVRDDRNSNLCTDCHAGKRMFDSSGQRNGNHAFNVEPTLATVAETLINNGAKRGFNQTIICQTCHKIHDNPSRQAALLIQDNQKSDLCLACHSDKRRLEKTKHNLAVSAKTKTNLAGETALDAGMCSACHLPHRPALKPYEEGSATDRTTRLCLSCHAEGRVAENKKLTGYLHPVNVGFPEGADSGKSGAGALPLFNDLGVTDPQGKITCATCHDIHGGAVVQKPAAAENEAARMQNTLLRKTSPEICRECHAQQFAIQNSRHDLQRVFPDGNAIIRQKVTQPGLCRNCHLIHSSQPDGFIWKKAATTPAGEPVADMCTACHAAGGLAPEMAVGKNSHPVNMLLAGRPRPQTLPLFKPQGRITAGDVMTCFTCHDPHRGGTETSRSGGDASVKGSAVSHFLRIEAAPDSDLCVDCHAEKADVRASDHNLLRTAPKVENALGRTPAESGVCGVCHIVHNSTEKIDLWAMSPGAGDNVMERMCNSCHSKNGAAAAKVPEVSSHPDTLFVSVWQSGGGDAQPFPFFDKRTGRISAVGNISCPSCHDVHHWGGKPSSGVGRRNLKGDVTTSFLRPHVADRVCKQCHGPEGLFVFKYFHKPGIRKRK